MESNVKHDIVKQILAYQSDKLQIVPGLFFNQYEMINLIHFHHHSKFQSGDTDDEGDRKYFFNINKNPCKVCSKGIAFATKNIRCLTTGGGDPQKTWFLERDLKYWMLKNNFGLVLDRLFRELPIFGTVVLKIVNGEPCFVDLRNFIVDQSADELDSSNYIIEIHNLSISKFRKIGKQMGWKQSDIDDVIKRFRDMDSSHIVLWEHYGEIRDEKGNYEYKRTFIADVMWNIVDLQGNKIKTERGIEMSSEAWDEHPYWEFHLEKIPGRWLGNGIVETLIEPQVRENELANLQAKSSYWAALRLFYSQDSNMGINLMSDKRNGDVITGDAAITQIDMSDRNLAFFNEEHSKWMSNRDDLVIAFAPVGHSVIAVQIAQEQVASYFEQIQRNVALRVKEMIYEVIIPQFEKDSNPEHTLRLVGQDLDIFIGMVKNDLVNKEIIRLALMSGNGKPFPTNHDRDIVGLAVEQAIKQGKEHILTVPKNAYKDVEYDIDIDIMGESVDSKARYQAKMSILQAITTDPTVLQDPTKKKILASMAEDAGLNANELFSTASNSQDVMNNLAPQGRGGGGVSAPSPMGGPTMATKTV